MPPIPPFRIYDRRSRTSASDQNRLRRSVEGLERFNGATGRRMAGFPYPAPWRDHYLWVRINAGTAPPYTNWDEVGFLDDGTVFVPESALTGGGTLNAYEVNGTPVQTPCIALARLSAEGGNVDFVAPERIDYYQIVNANSGSTHTDFTQRTRLHFQGGETATGGLGYGGVGILGFDISASDETLLQFTVAELVTLNNSATFSFDLTKWAHLVVRTFSGAMTDTLPQPGGGSGIGHGWWVDVDNNGSGTITLSSTSSTIDGASSISILPNQGVRIVCDGTNYYTMRGLGSTLASPLTTKGDIWVYSTADTRLPVGTNGQFLVADSTQATGLKWSSLSGAGGAGVYDASATGVATTTTYVTVFDVTVTGGLHGSFELKNVGANTLTYKVTLVGVDGTSANSGDVNLPAGSKVSFNLDGTTLLGATAVNAPFREAKLEVKAASSTTYDWYYSFVG